MGKLRNPFQRTRPDTEEHGTLQLDPEHYHVISREEGKELLDPQARNYLNMSGEEFARRYHAGELDYEQSEVIRVSYALSFAEGPTVNGQKKHTR